MAEDGKTTEQKNLYNLKKLSLSGSALEERRLCELYELSFAAADSILELYGSGLGLYEALAVLSEESFERSLSIHSGALLQNVHWLGLWQGTTETLDKTVFCKMLADRLAERGISVKEADFLESERVTPSVVYVRNQLSDEAFEVFSDELADPTVRYVQSFKEAISAVENGEAGYCLLPLEEKGVRLHSVCSLLYSKDLKIGSVTPVFGFDGSADMKYALVSKCFSVPETLAEDDRYLELRISREGRLSELLSVAEYYGSEVYKIGTVYYDGEEGPVTQYSLIFKEEGRDFVPILLYLTLFTADFIPVGIYRNIE